MHTATLRFVFPLALVGFTLVGCGPRIDAAAKADIDRRVAALTPSGHGFPVPTVFAPKSLVPGQWTQHKMTSEKGEVSLMTYKIVGAEADAYWVEMASETYYGKTVTKLLLAVGDRMNPSTMEIRAVKLKDKDGRVSQVEGPMIQLMKSMWQSSVNMLAVSWQGLPQEDVSVVAGNFAASFKARTDASWGAWRSTSTTWMHPIVPISSLVKSVGVDKPHTMELVGFGESGAVSEIP